MRGEYCLNSDILREFLNYIDFLRELGYFVSLSGFSDRFDYYKRFFEKYSNRIMLGTDSTFPYEAEGMEWLNDRVYRFIATDDTTKAFADRMLTGIKLNEEQKTNIIWRNFERRVSEKPKKINKEALKRYIEKYKHLIVEKEYLDEVERLYKEML